MAPFAPWTKLEVSHWFLMLIAYHDPLWISRSFCIGALHSDCVCGNSTTFQECLDHTCASEQLEKDEQSGKTSLLKALWGLDILKDSWSPSLSVFKCLESIRALMADPNPDDAMRQWIAAPWLKTSHQCIWQIWPEQLDSITLSDFDVIWCHSVSDFLDFSHSEVTVTERVQELTLAHKPLGIRFASRASCSSRSTVWICMANDAIWIFMDASSMFHGFGCSAMFSCLVWARFERGRAMEQTPDTLTRLEKTQRRTPVWTSMLGIFWIGKMAWWTNSESPSKKPISK